MVHVFQRNTLQLVRCFGTSVRALSDDGFDFTQIIKSNSLRKGFNDIEMKQKTKSQKKEYSMIKQDSSTTNDENNKKTNVSLVNDTVDNFCERRNEAAKNSTKDTQPVRKPKVLKPQIDINGERYKIRIPDWMDMVYECPTSSGDNVHEERFGQFKEFIEELEIRNLPSVTSIIKKTEPENQATVLHNWAKRKTKELGEKQFQEYRQKLLTRGSSLHSCIELYLAGACNFEVAEHIEGAWESVQHVLTNVDNVKKTEKVIVHPELFYKGQIDCLAAYRNEMSLVEWKVSSKPKIMLSQTYDNPLQVAAYVGALNRSGILKRLQVQDITTGVLVIAYEDGEPANVHIMNERLCNKYWCRWTERLYHYWALQYQELMTS